MTTRTTIGALAIQRVWMAAVTILLSACGGGHDVPQQATTQTLDAPAAQAVTRGVSLVAGILGGSGHADRQGDEARLYTPYALAAGPDGNIYFTGWASIRRASLSGAVDTWAGTARDTGYANGSLKDARFSLPKDLVFDSRGNLYVINLFGRTLQRITPDGQVSLYAGGGTDNDCGRCPCDDAESVPPLLVGFKDTEALGIDAADNIYVLDGNRVVRISPSQQVTQLAQIPTGGDAFDMAVTRDGTVYVPDANRHVILRLEANGNWSVLAGALGQAGVQDGTGTQARLSRPLVLDMGRDGEFFFAENGSQLVRRVTADGKVSTIAGSQTASGYVDGPANVARFQRAQAFARGNDGALYVADDSRIRRINDQGIVTTLAGLSGAGHADYVDGSPNQARFYFPQGQAVAADGTLYVADQRNGVVRQIKPNGQVSTVRDSNGDPFRFNSPSNLALHPDGSLYVSDSYFPTPVLYRVVPGGSATPVEIKLDPTAPNLPYFEPGTLSARGLAIDAAGRIFIADPDQHLIRRIDPDGIIRTVAGGPGEGYVDGPATQARFNFPVSVALDSNGNLYVGDGGNQAIRKITPDGNVTTLAGGPDKRGYVDGPAAQAKLVYPVALTVGNDNAIYIADAPNGAVRKLVNGVMSTVSGAPEQNGVLLGALPGGLNLPYGLVWHQGGLFVSDGQEQAILRVELP